MEKQIVRVLIGASASGKSKYVSENSDGFVVLSSDSIRKELFGDLTHQETTDHQKVFDVLHDRLVDYLKEGKSVIYDATNLSRKRRIHLYNHIIKPVNKDIIVEAMMFIEPFNIIEANNRRKPVEERLKKEDLMRLYQGFVIPKIGVDCDTMLLQGGTYFFNKGYTLTEVANVGRLSEFYNMLSRSYQKDMNKIFLDHDTPFHLESISDHIDVCVINSGDDLLHVLISLFHDLGKSITKDGGKYYNHQNVSAMYILRAFGELIPDDNFSYEDIMELSLIVSEAVLHHMSAHQGLSEKTIKRNKLDENMVKLINEFVVIDDKSRQTEELDGGFVQYVDSLKDLEEGEEYERLG